MKKILFSLLAFACLSTNYHAQSSSQKISFETSEGYTVGKLDQVNGWNVWPENYNFDGNVVVENGSTTDGKQFLWMKSHGEPKHIGVEKNIAGYPMTRISFDMKVTAKGMSDNVISILDQEDNVLGGVIMNWEGLIGFGNYFGRKQSEIKWTKSTYNPNVWYNIMMDFDGSSGKVTYYVNNKKVLEGTYRGEISIFDVMFDNDGSDLQVDNIKILDLENLSTNNIAKGSVFIYPNPATEIIFIDVEGRVESFEVYDISGKLVKVGEEAQKSMKVEDLHVGNYVVKVKTTTGVFSGKFIKK